MENPVRPELNDLSFRVVVYKDGADYVAHALEADLVGYGATQTEALDEVSTCLSAQISFAMQQGDPGLVFKDAPPDVMKMWKETQPESVLIRAMEKLQTSSKKKPSALKGPVKQSAPRKREVWPKYLSFTEKDVARLGTQKLNLASCC